MATGKYNYLVTNLQGVKPRILTRALEKVFAPAKDLVYTYPVAVSLPKPTPSIYGPQVDLTKTRVAYGSWAVPNLIRDLKSEDPVLVIQAINSIADLIHNPEKTFEFIRYDIVDHVANLMMHEYQDVRVKCAAILATVASQDAGREAILVNETVLDNLKEMMIDDADEVRLQTCQTLEMIARSPNGVSTLNDADFLSLIMDDIEDEYSDDVMLQVLEILQHLLEEERAISEAVDYGIISVMWPLLEHPNTNVVTGALSCLARVLSSDDGKKDAGERLAFVRSLVTCLYSKDRRVVAKSATVLMFYTIPVDSRKNLLKWYVFPRLVEMATDPACKETQVAAIKVLTNLAETPNGRQELLRDHVTELESMSGLEDEDVARHASTLLKVIHWKP